MRKKREYLYVNKDIPPGARERIFAEVSVQCSKPLLYEYIAFLQNAGIEQYTGIYELHNALWSCPDEESAYVEAITNMKIAATVEASVAEASGRVAGAMGKGKPEIIRLPNDYSK